jgi:hypothetical protein
MKKGEKSMRKIEGKVFVNRKKVLTPEEKADLADDLSTAILEMESLEEKKAEAVKNFNEEIKIFEKAIQEKAVIYKDGFFFERDVECETFLDDEKKERVIVDLDGNEVERMPFFPEDLQKPLFEDENEPEEIPEEITKDEIDEDGSDES